MKLFVQETHSDVMREAAQASTALIVSQLTWVEMCAALALKQRTRQIDAPHATQALQELRQQWASFNQLAVDTSLITAAGEMAQAFNLRAYDSLQLASAQRVHGQGGATVSFCCFDKQLNAAAAALGMRQFLT